MVDELPAELELKEGESQLRELGLDLSEGSYLSFMQLSAMLKGPNAVQQKYHDHLHSS
jgi:hypothetical protein